MVRSKYDSQVQILVITTRVRDKYDVAADSHFAVNDFAGASRLAGCLRDAPHLCADVWLWCERA